MTDGRLRLLVVCTANICRSAMAEHLLRAAATERELDLEVSSAGFMFDGEPASDRAVAVMAERGLDLSDHRSRVVTAEMLEAADLVVTMERRHARELIVEHTDTAVRIHTLGGLADTLADLEPDGDLGPAERVALATRTRRSADLLGTGPDDVADPHGRSRRRHRLAADRIAVLVDALLDGLFTDGS